MAATDDIVHLLRRTEYVARPERVAALIPGTYAAAVDDVLNVPAGGVADPGRARVPRRQQQLQPVHAGRAVVVRTDGQDVDPADPGEDGVLLARALLQRVGQGVRHRGDDAAEQAVPRQRPRQRADARPGDGDPAGDAALPRQRRQPQELAEPELRPRAARAVPARRRELHRGRRRSGDVGVDRAWPRRSSDQYVFRPSQHDSTVRTFLGQPVSNGPDVIDVVLGPDRGDRGRPERGHAGEGRGGSLPQQEVVGGVRLPGARRRRSSTPSATCSWPTTSRSRRGCVRC